MVSAAAPLPVDGSGVTQPVSAASLPLPTGAATSAAQTTGNTSLATVAGAVAGTEMQVDVLTVPSPLSSAGGGVEAAALRVTIASDSTGLVSVDDNGGSLTVDAASLPLPTGAATSALQLADGHNVTVDNAAGAAAVNIQDGGNTITVDGTVTANLAAGTNTNEVVGDVAHDIPITGNPVTIGGVASAAAPADVSLDQDAVRIWCLRNGAQAAVITAAGALIGGDAANGLDVDVIRLPASTNTIEVVGDVAHDAAAAGNPVLVAASHETIADSAPTNRLASVTDGDATRLSAMDGAVFVIPSGPQQWKARLTGTMTDTTVKAAAGAGLSLYIQTVVCSIGAATASSILLEESTTTAVFGPHYLEAINGRGLALSFNPPIKIAANTLLSATSTGSATITLDVYGFTAPG